MFELNPVTTAPAELVVSAEPAVLTNVQTHVDVMQVLSALGPVERTALALVYGRGLTQAEIANELGLPISTIGAAVARGLCQLAARIIAQ